MRRCHRAALLIIATLLGAGCAPQPPLPTQPAQPTPAAFPAASDVPARYEAIARAGHPVYDVDAARSVVVMEVRRAGTLANLGHDHVVASHDVHGYVAPSEGRADLALRVEAFVVDEPALRAAAGFDTQPSEADIAGTRRNMLTRVLSSDAHPFVLVHVDGARSATGTQVLHPGVTVNGVERAAQATAMVTAGADDIRVRGETVIRQTDYGIRPFSILGGALEVADAVTIKFDVVARKR